MSVINTKPPKYYKVFFEIEKNHTQLHTLTLHTIVINYINKL